MNENKYKRLGKNSLYVFIGNIGGRAISFLMMPFYTRFLSQSSYGAGELIQNYAIILLDLMTFCICSAIFVYPKTASEEEKKRFFTSGLVYSFIPILLILFLIYIIANTFLSIENVFRKHFVFIALLSIAWFLQVYFQNFLRSIDKIDVYCYTGGIYTGSTALFSFVLIPTNGLDGYIGALIGANSVTAIFSFFYARLWTYLDFKVRIYYYKRMLGYSSPLVGTTILTFLNAYLCRPLLEYYHGLESVGIFAVANKFSSIIYTLIPVFCLSWQTSVLEEFNKKDYQHFFNKTFHFLFVGLILICVFLLPFYRLLLQWFVSSEYYLAWKYMPLMVTSTIFSFYSQFTTANFLAAKKSQYILFSSIISAIFSLVLNFVLIPHYGIWGAIIASIMTSLSSSIAKYFFSRQYVKLENGLLYSSIIICYVLTSVITVFVSPIVSFLISFSIIAIICIVEKSQINTMCVKVQVFLKKSIKYGKA